MKRILYISMISLMASCTGSNQKPLTSGIDKADMDTTIVPGTDFYQYATGGWQKAHPLTAEYSRYGSFDLLAENTNEQLRSIIDSVASLSGITPGSVEHKIATLYKSAMDSTLLNSDGMNQMKLFLQVDGNQDSEDIARQWIDQAWPRMQKQGITGLFDFYIGADEKDSKNNILYIYQGGLTLEQKEYYLDSDPATTAIRQAYEQYIVRLARHCGFSERNAQRMLSDVMRIETRMATASRSMTELRDPERNYNKFTYAQLKEQYPALDWDAYFANFGIKNLKHVIVGQPEALAQAMEILSQEGPEALQNLYLWHGMDMAANYVDDESRTISFDFWGKAKSGIEQDRPRWKRAVRSVEDCLGEALGQLYVSRFFPPEAKERMLQLVANLQEALGQRIDQQDWMSDATKRVAHEKLDAFYVKVGYPDKWKDYTRLEIGPNYLENVLMCKWWQICDMVATRLNKPVDRDEWHMTPQTVNAYYNPTTNEICFTAGILQRPFFDMNADDAFNYGAIGVVIGHEMTHGFDDQGSKYDKDGNLRQWWTDEDTERFAQRIATMRTYHDSIQVLPGLYANGSFTLGENIADHGGLVVSLQALKNQYAKQSPDAINLDIKDGFTGLQRFFLAYAGVWAQNIRDEEIRNRVKGDPHQLGKWRVNGQMPHVDEWYEAFDITPDAPMYVKPEERVKVW